VNRNRLLNGLNHAAILTVDLDRFVDFYTRVFETEVVFSETTPVFRHAILRTGPDSWLHPAEVRGNLHAAAIPAMFTRGHLDHIALTARSRDAFEEIRRRLIEAQASDGTIEDLGAFHAMWFNDPDGMRGEVIAIVDPTLRGIHEPRVLPSN
jgi:catechol 2,3-dioxygenase-like lactoylglutathione lyase family enzyme